MRSSSKKLAALILAVSTILNGCTITSVTYESIPLQSEFTQSSTKIDIAFPMSLLSEDVYNMSIGKFAITNTDIPFGSTKAEKTSSEYKVNLPEVLVGDDWLVDAQKYELVTKQKFSFDVSVPQQDKVNLLIPSACKTNGFATKVEKERIFGDKPQGESSQLQSTQIKCTINMNGEEYFLFMRNERGVVPRISLRNNNRSFRFETEYLSQGIKQDQSGKNTSFLQDNNDLMGLIIFEGSQQIAAVSFTNTPSIWYSNSLAKEQQGLTLAVAYSFLMHKRLNREWESLNNHYRVRK